VIGKLRERRLVAKDTYEMTFSLSERITFLPGQYVTISIPQPVYEDYQLNRRIFSLVNSPTQNDIAKILFRYRDSGFKRNLVEMTVGSEVRIEEPVGMFQLPDDETIPLVFLATGVGAAPFVSALSLLREQKSQRQITFFFSNYSSETTPYFDLLTNLTKDLASLRLVPIMTRDEKWTGEKERVSINMIKSHIQEFARANFFLAGLPEFVDYLVRQLLEAGIPKESVAQESFDGY
jgi:ferredoxin-NADP reductase